MEKRFQRILEKPLRTIQNTLIQGLLGLILCMSLHALDIGSNEKILGAAAFAIPIDAYLCIMEYRFKKITKKVMSIGIKFDLGTISALILLIISLGAYSFDRQWYIYGLAAALAINLFQLYLVGRQMHEIYH